MKKLPLQANVSRGVLTIKIGIDTLAFAALNSEYAYELMGAKQGRPDSRFRIGDKLEFARDVVRELVHEAEDGSSLLTALLDTACQKAIEEGSFAFIDSKEES